MSFRPLNRDDLIKLINNLKTDNINLVFKLLYNTYIDENTGCWFRALDRSVYSIVEGKRAHRLSYELFIGKITKEYICHKCDRPGCFNPDHLFQGTASDNIQDALDKGRMKRFYFTKNSLDKKKNLNIEKLEYKEHPEEIFNDQIEFEE